MKQIGTYHDKGFQHPHCRVCVFSFPPRRQYSNVCVVGLGVFCLFFWGGSCSWFGIALVVAEMVVVPTCFEAFCVCGAAWVAHK